jgi:hypothetical protein
VGPRAGLDVSKKNDLVETRNDVGESRGEVQGHITALPADICGA